ncbi:MAG: LacI family transcriptional regulator [Erysipelothrix sp.]|nr:LacI family transcriptional regulator [Erysipelothrix sp.]
MSSMLDVAKRAGVGVSTVSKVLNNYENVSQETKDKVMKAVEELNYVPNAVASALSSKKNKRIGVVVFINNKRQAIDEINMQYLFGTFEEANSLKLEIVTVFSSVFENMSKIEMIQYFKSLSVQGLIVYGLHKEQTDFTEMIDEQHFYSVLVDVPIQNEKTSYVMIDHQTAQYKLAKYMIESQPHAVRNVLYLAGRRDGYVTDLRLQGVVDACLESDINLNAQYADFSERKAIELTKAYGMDADIIICASDLMAIGSINALKEMDIFRPVCGYDGIKLLGYVKYHIQTVKQDFFSIAKRAVQEYSHLIETQSSQGILMDYEITRIGYDDVII